MKDEAKTMKTFHSLAVGLRPAFSILARRIAIPLLLLTAGMMVVQPCLAQETWFWKFAGGTARANHTATLLQNGMVLVAGGRDNRGPLASAELGQRHR